MKILLVLENLPTPPDDGIKLTDYNIVKNLSVENSCEIIAYSGGDLSSDIYNNVGVYLVKQSSKLMMKLNRIWNYFKGIPMPMGINYSGRYKRRLLGLIKHNRYDVIIFDYFNTMFYLRYIKNIPSVLSVADSPAKTYKSFFENATSIIKKLYYKIAFRQSMIAEKKLFCKADKVVVVSEEDASFIKKSNPLNKVEVIPIQIEDSKFKVAQKLFDRNNINLLFIGNVNIDGIRNGFESFLDGPFVQLKNKHPGIKLTALVRNKKLLRERNIADIRIEDFINNEDYNNLICEADIIIFPDKTGSGLKNRVLDAFSKGKCVVGSESALTGFNVKQNGIAVLADNTDDFFSKIDDLIICSDRINETGIKAYNHAKENYAASIINRKWTNMLSEINKEVII